MGASHKIYYVGASIGSTAALAKTLSFTEDRLIAIAADVPSFYTEFEKIVKEKVRNLAEPRNDLKILQKRIISRIFSNIRFPHYLHGGIKSKKPRDFVTNASAHCGAEVAIALDIRNFFPSINEKQVEDVFLRLFRFSPDVSSTLAKLTTLRNSVPQGAPTSSYIANLVMYEKEYKLAAKLEAQHLSYTRLIDDITISSKKALLSDKVTKITTDVIRMLNSYGYEAHPDKTHIYSRKNPHKLMVITGLWLNRGAPRIKRARRAEIATEVLELKKLAEIEGTWPDQYHTRYESISGKVALLQRMGHSESGRLRKILERIKPTFNDSGVGKISKLVKDFSKKVQDSTKLGYIKRFYLLQHSVAIVKRTRPKLARSLQRSLNHKRPQTRLRDIYE